MNIQPDYTVEIRKEGSEKTLVLIDKLTEAEANKGLSRFPSLLVIKGMKCFIFSRIWF
jgi:hypothetical protein